MLRYKGSIKIALKNSKHHTDFLQLRKLTVDWQHIVADYDYGNEPSKCPLEDQCLNKGCAHFIDDCVGMKAMMEIFPKRNEDSNEYYPDRITFHLKFPEPTMRAFQACTVKISDARGELYKKPVREPELVFSGVYMIDWERTLELDYTVSVIQTPDPRVDLGVVKTPIDRLNFNNLSDVTIKVNNGDKSFDCHKIQLAKSSPVFEVMFKNGWEESGDKKTISIDNFDEETVKSFIDYIYIGEMEDESHYTTQLLAIAHQYEVTDLVTMCARHLVKLEITAKNVVDIWQCCELFEQPNLRMAVYRFMAANWRERDSIPGMKELEEKRGDYLASFVTYLLLKAKGN